MASYTQKSSDPGCLEVFRTGTRGYSETDTHNCARAFGSHELETGIPYEDTLMQSLAQIGICRDSSSSDRSVTACIFLKGLLVTTNESALANSTCVIANMVCAPFNGQSQSGPQTSRASFTIRGALLVPITSKTSTADVPAYHVKVSDCYQHQHESYIDTYYYLTNIECAVVTKIDIIGAYTETGLLTTEIPTNYAEAANSQVTEAAQHVTILSLRLKESIDQAMPYAPAKLTVEDAIIQVGDDVITLTGNTKIRDDQLVVGWSDYYSSMSRDFGDNIFWCRDVIHEQYPDVLPKITSTTFPPFEDDEVGISKVNTIFTLEEANSFDGTNPADAYLNAFNADSLMNQYGMALELEPVAVQQYDQVFTTGGHRDLPMYHDDAIDPELDWQTFVGFISQNKNYAVLNDVINHRYIPADYQGNTTDEKNGYIAVDQIVPTPIELVNDYVDHDLLQQLIDTKVFMDSSTYITPMDYYSNISKADEQFEGKLEDDTNVPSEPVYFWVETLKNWCTYTTQTLDDAATVAVLSIWNGVNDFLPLHMLIDHMRRDVQYSSTSLPSWISEEDFTRRLSLEDRTKVLLQNDYIKMNALSWKGFSFENLRTVDILRTYKGPPADYTGLPSKSWLDYLGPLGSIIRAATHTWRMIWDLSVIGMTVNYFARDMTITDTLNEVGRDAKATGAALLYATVQTLATPLVVWPSAYAHVQMQAARSYERLINGAPGHNVLFDTDHWQNLFATCRYVLLPYDEKYSSNSSHTYQTLRPTITQEKYHLEGGLREKGDDDAPQAIDTRNGSTIPYIVIPNPIGSMFTARAATGELMLAMVMAYSGPVQEKIDEEKDLLKRSGVTAHDIAFANELLRSQLGAGYDKTIDDWLNDFGPDDSSVAADVTNIPITSRLSNESILQENVQIGTGHGTIVITANRSKTSTEPESATINTVTKW